MKIRVMYYVLCIMGILFFVLPLILNTYPISPVQAADSTPSADIKAKLEELKKEIASKAAQLKQTVDRKLKNKAYIGTIKQKSDNSITLATTSNPKLISINQDTIIAKKIKLEDYVAALGDADETGVLTARKIILLPTANSEKRKAYLWGQVISISDQLVTLKNSDSKNVAVSLPSLSGIKLNSFVILTGFKDKNDIFKAEFIYKIPEGGVIKPKKIATPSAKVATPAAKPKR